MNGIVGLRYLKNYYGFLILFCLLSCNPQKNSTKFNSGKRNYSGNIVTDINNRFNYSSCQIKCKISLTGNEGQNFNTIIKARKDSFIIISVFTSLNIEILKLCFTKDSFKLLNRVDKIYYSGCKDSVLKIIEMNYDFNLIESLLFGKICSCCQLSGNEYLKNNILYSDKCSNNLKFVNYILSKDNRAVLKAKIFGVRDVVNVEYFYNDKNELKYLSGGLFVSNGNLKFNIDFEKIKEKNVSYKFDIPSNYKFNSFK